MDTQENLKKMMAGSSQIIVEIAAEREELEACWAEMAEVKQYDVSPAQGEFHRCALTPRDGLDLRPLTFTIARLRGWTLSELTRSRHTLEDIYLQVTKPDEEDER